MRSCLFFVHCFFFFFASFLLSVSFQSLFLLSTSQFHSASRHDRCHYIQEPLYTYAPVPQYHTLYLIVLSFRVISRADERGIKKIATNGKIWKSRPKAGDRCEDFSSFAEPSLRMSRFKPSGPSSTPLPVVTHASGDDGDSEGLYPGIVYV